MRDRSDNSADESEIRASAVTLENFGDYNLSISDSTLATIENTLFNRVRKYSSDPSRGYTGTIRKNTTTTTYVKYEGSDTPINIPTVKFLVDIPKVKQTYEVSLSGGEEYPYNILYVLCPNKTQLKYPGFGCVNEDQ
jgi:hypothetical protein